MRAQRRTQNGGGVRKRTTQEMRAQRRTQFKVRAQRRTQNEVGLENTLPKRWWWNTDLTNALWFDMHVYSPEKYRSPFLHGVFLFLKVRVLVVNFDGLFTLVNSSYILWFWPFRKGLMPLYLFVLQPLSQGLSILPDIFLYKRNHGVNPTMCFLLPPSLIMPPKCSIRVWGWGYVKEGLTRSCFHVEILKFQSYSRYRNHFDIDSKQTRSEKIQVIVMERLSDENFLFCS
jgi:hypothetical protein